MEVEKNHHALLAVYKRLELEETFQVCIYNLLFALSIFVFLKKNKKISIMLNITFGCKRFYTRRFGNFLYNIFYD
jgi:hypothetical protein